MKIVLKKIGKQEIRIKIVNKYIKKNWKHSEL